MSSNIIQKELSLLSELAKRGFTVRPSSLERDQDAQDIVDSRAKAFQELPHWLENTPFDIALVFTFDTPTYNWLERLRCHAFKPNWHLLTIDPEFGLDEVESWTMVAPSKQAALAWVLEQLDITRIPVVDCKLDEGGAVTILGEELKTIKIDPVSTSRVEDSYVTASRRAIRNLRIYDTHEAYMRKLSKIDGFTTFKPEKYESNNNKSKAYSNRQCLHITSANLCTSFLEALQPHVDQKLPRSVCQELLAHFFDFESWNHLRGLESQRESHMSQPFLLEHLDEQGLTTNTPLLYADLPSGLAAFGQRIKGNKGAIHVNSSTMYFTVTTTPRSRGSYDDQSGFTLSKLHEVSADEQYGYLAATMLDSPNLAEDMRAYCHAGLNPFARKIKIDARNGIHSEDNLLLGDWVFSINTRLQDPLIFIERLSNIGTNSHYAERYAGPVRKTFVVQQDDEFWIAYDWSKKKKLKLAGLSAQGINSFQNRFLPEGNRCDTKI